MKKFFYPSIYVGRKWKIIYDQVKAESKRTRKSIAEIIWTRVWFAKDYDSLYQTWLNKPEVKERLK